MSHAAASGNQNEVGQLWIPVKPYGLVSLCTTQPAVPNISAAVTRPGGRSASMKSCSGAAVSARLVTSAGQ